MLLAIDYDFDLGVWGLDVNVGISPTKFRCAWLVFGVGPFVVQMYLNWGLMKDSL